MRDRLDLDITAVENRLLELQEVREAVIAFGTRHYPVVTKPVSGRSTLVCDVVHVFESTPLEVLDTTGVMIGLALLGRKVGSVKTGNAIQYAIRLGKVGVVSRGRYTLGRSASCHRS